MRAAVLSWYLLSFAAVTCTAGSALADESDACSHFRWDVTHELAVMKQTPKPVAMATKPGSTLPSVKVDTLYELKLAPQSTVTYAAPPAKPTLDDSAQGGLVRFHTDKAGLYRVSITTGHWIDVVAGASAVKSQDFQGSHGCRRPHKIVVFELPAARDLILQLSGAADSPVLVAITPAAATTQH